MRSAETFLLLGAVVQVILTQLPGQEIQFELFDKDIDQDDFLGRFVQHIALHIKKYCNYSSRILSNRFLSNKLH